MEKTLMTLFLLSAFLVMFSGAQPIYHPQNERFSKDCENVYQVLREFRRDIDELKHSIKQLQIREQGEGAYIFFKIIDCNAIISLSLPSF